MTSEPGNLSDAFGPAALSGLLARRTPTAPAPAEGPAAAEQPRTGGPPTDGADPREETSAREETGSAAQPTEPIRKGQSRGRRRAADGPARAGKPTSGREPQPPAASSPEPAADPVQEEAQEEAPVDDGITSQVSVYLAADALLVVRQTRRTTGQTNAEIAFAAIDATHDRLAELVAARRRGADRPAGSLFPARQSTRAARGQARRVVLWAMRATRAELAVVDRLVDQVDAGSRSELIAAAVEAHLLGNRPAR